MKQRIQGLVSGIVIGAMGASVIAYAKSGSEWIEAVYSNIKLYVNDVQINSSGNEPFIYNGSTYLPVRAVSEALGEPVSWDGNTKSVYIGKHGATNLMDICPPYDYGSTYEAYLAANGESFSMGGNRYSNGFSFCCTSTAYALINLNGKYSNVKLTVGHVDAGYDTKDSVVSFVVDGVVVKQLNIGAQELPQTISVPLNYGLQLKIVAADDHNGSTWVGFGNIVLQ